MTSYTLNSPAESAEPKASLTDEQLMLSYQRGDLAAFETLYQRTSGRVYGYLRKRLNRSEDTDEVLQQVFMKLHHARHQYLGEHHFQHWLFVICRTTLFDFLRKNQRQLNKQTDLSIEEFEQITSTQFPSPSFETIDSVAPRIEKMLSTEQSQILKWRVLDELTYQEISARLNKTESMVRQSFSRSVKKLKRLRWSND